MQGLPERVLAPQRGLDSIGPVLRGWSPVIRLTCVLAQPEKVPVHLRPASEISVHLAGRAANSQPCAARPPWRLRHVPHDCLAAFGDADMLDCDLLFATGAVAFKRFHLGSKCPGHRSALSCCSMSSTWASRCSICGRKPSDPHHLGFTQPRALGRKVSDEFAVPLCRGHHRAVHRSRDERGWWRHAGIDPIKVARRLWKETHEMGQPPSHRAALPRPRGAGAFADVKNEEISPTATTGVVPGAAAKVD
jgi:hypothetical protein